ncbi:HTH_48 domain-containing protein [Trichonephila clavipes]|nr:HTH_48 domain-containing protein [Trichonephila clavipes]
MLKPYHRRSELLNVVLVDTEEIIESSELEEDFPYMLTDPNVFDFREIVENNKLGKRLSDKQFMQLGKLLSDRQLSIRAIAETINNDKECVRQILHGNLNMQKECAKMVPKILTFEQQATRKNVCTDILDAIKNDPNLLEKVIICDES